MADVVAGETAVEPTDICLLDLVRVESKGDGRGFHGLVLHLQDQDVNSSYYPPLPAGKIRILRADGTFRHEEPGDVVTVVDRNYFVHGQVVVSPAGRIGIVTGVNTVLDLVKPSDREPPGVVMSGVSPDSLRRVRELCLGDFVVSGPWLGRVVEVSLNFNVSFDDGAVCRVIRDAHSSKLRQVLTDCRRVYGRQTNSYFYPGQRVTGPADVFKACRWLNGYWRRSHRVGTVSKVKMAGVLVHWVASARHGTDQQLIQASAPPAYQHPDNLTFFCPGFDCHWDLGDRCFLRHKGTCSSRSDAGNDHQPSVDSIHKQDHSSSSPAKAHAQKKLHFRIGQRRTRREQRRLAAFEQPMSVVSTSTTYDVLWQDGTRQTGAPSTSLRTFQLTSEYEFLPEHYVVDKASAGTAEASGQTRRVGVVRSMSFEDQTVRVLWFNQASSNPDEGATEDDTVSAYDLAWKLDLHVYYGQVVVRSTAVVQAPVQGRKMRAQAAADLSWVGRVVDLRDGRVQVKWGDGTMSTVLRHEMISVVKQQRFRELHAEMGINAGGDSESDDDDSVDDDGTVPADEDRIDSMDEDGTAAARASRLGAIVQSVLRLASRALAPAMRYLPNRSASSSSELDAATANVGPFPALVTDGNAIHATAAAAISHDDDAGADDDDSAEKGESTTAQGTGFPHFDVTQSPPDHHYIDNVDQRGDGGKKWVKAVQKEWKILENNLPGTIYVRAFEDRMDLLRVVMVGASGTPYQDGLFFFDLHLPPSYPAVPPLVYYHSFGLKLNPNLYDSGTVCLSLLNTFGGEGSEVWLPESSTLLQVVVSIQGLILNNQPFFNEAGYDALVGKPEGRRNALPYSENAYLLTLRSMLHLLRRPPQGFEEFVRDHFHSRGRFVLRACEAYLRGCIVGTLDGDAHATEGSKEEEHRCSAGLRLVLANVVPRLVTEFAEIGAEGCNCDQFHGLRDMLIGTDVQPCAA